MQIFLLFLGQILGGKLLEGGTPAPPCGRKPGLKIYEVMDHISSLSKRKSFEHILCQNS